MKTKRYALGVELLDGREALIRRDGWALMDFIICDPLIIEWAMLFADPDEVKKQFNKIQRANKGKNYNLGTENEAKAGSLKIYEVDIEIKEIEKFTVMKNKAV